MEIVKEINPNAETLVDYCKTDITKLPKIINGPPHSLARSRFVFPIGYKGDNF